MMDFVMAKQRKRPDEMISLYDSPVSPCCMKVRLCLKEKGLDYESVPVDLGGKANLEDSYLILNPKGVVPTLVDDGSAIIESTLINEFLDEKYPSIPLKPAAAEEKVEMRLWTKFIDEELHPANGAVIWPILSLERLSKQDPDEVIKALSRHPDPKRVARQTAIFKEGYVAPVVGEGLRVFVKMLEKAETSLQDRDYLAADDISLADIGLLPYVNEVVHFGLSPMIADKPKTSDWFKRMSARHSYSQAIASVLEQSQWDAIAERGSKAWTEMQNHLD